MTSVQLLVFALCLAMLGCAANPLQGEPAIDHEIDGRVANPLITHGSNAKKGTTPYLVSIQAEVYGVYQHVCGGSLLKPNKVLTAAHCSIPCDRFPCRAALGYYKISDGESQAGSQVIMVKEAKKHPEYKTGNALENNDVMILTLESSADITATVKLVELSTVNVNDAVGRQVQLDGWGETSPGSGSSDVLQHLEMTVISMEDCKKEFRPFMFVPQHMCAIKKGADPPADSCVGDSGGPLMLEGKQVGITSWGSPTCGIGKPSVYGNIAALRQWIDQNSA